MLVYAKDQIMQVGEDNVKLSVTITFWTICPTFSETSGIISNGQIPSNLVFCKLCNYVKNVTWICTYKQRNLLDSHPLPGSNSAHSCSHDYITHLLCESSTHTTLFGAAAVIPGCMFYLGTGACREATVVIDFTARLRFECQLVVNVHALLSIWLELNSRKTECWQNFQTSSVKRHALCELTSNSRHVIIHILLNQGTGLQ